MTGVKPGKNSSRSSWRVMVASVTVSILTLSAASFAQIVSGKETTVKGIIVARNGDEAVIRQPDNTKIVAVLDDNTKVEKTKGKLGIRKDTMDETMLVPGLAVEAEGVGNAAGQLAATKFKFSSGSFKTAQAISAGTSTLESQQQQTATGLSQTQGQVQQNANAIAENAVGIKENSADMEKLNSRVSDMDDYATKVSSSVYFDTGKSDLSQEAKQKLDEVAKEAQPLQGYMIEVSGHASTTGSAKVNQELSDKRAENVVEYLQQHANVPLRRILAPVGMGTAKPAASNDNPQGLAENQRVDVKILVNKGLTAQTD
jgi:OmpA-OmpF porin, OOP family